MTRPLPTGDAFTNLAGMLVGKKLKATRGAPLPLASVAGVATYIDANAALHFVVVTDVAFIAGIGAALAMIPLPVVTEAIRTGKLSEALVENAYEVLNVASSLLNEMEGATTHVKVERLRIGPVDPALAKQLAKPAARLDLIIGIPGYPDGKFGLLTVG
jgi:hypothetical protein